MALQTIGLGTAANDGTGDDLRTAGGKINSMLGELYGRPRLIVSRAAINGQNSFMTVANAFTTIVMTTVSLDTASKYSTSTGIYTVPTTGTYAVIGTMRLIDSASANINYGIGVDTTNVDNSGFDWAQTNSASRQGRTKTRLLQLTANDQLRLYAYIDSATAIGISSAELNVWQIA